MDVQSLNVPADFAAIFDKQAIPANDVPSNSAPAVPVSSSAPVVPTAAATPEKCSKCGSRLSGVEAKMGRCLTCGTTLSAGSYTVGL
jgi:hypothetical protein